MTYFGQYMIVRYIRQRLPQPPKARRAANLHDAPSQPSTPTGTPVKQITMAVSEPVSRSTR